MILQLEVKSGAIFTLDKELLTWERVMNDKRTHGKMYMWPHDIAIGKGITVFNTAGVSSCVGVAFTTTPIVSIKTVTRDEPDFAPSNLNATV